MSETIKVMLCDDSSTMRRLIKTAFKKDPTIEVVFEAANGREAVENIASSQPDIVVMDIEMPVMDGIEATIEIRKQNQRLPIVMFSSLTSRGAEATLDGLAAGANDFALKPAASGHIANAMQQIETDLILKIKQLVSRNRNSAGRDQPASAADSQVSSLESSIFSLNRKVDLIAIGVSTGGPDALQRLLSAIPSSSLTTPILITQHMPPVFTSLLAQRLTAQTGHLVCEAKDDEPIVPDRILIAPGDFHLTVQKSAAVLRAHLDQKAHENSCRPAVDPLFRSVAGTCGRQSLGIVLTGMGQDGMKGASDIKSSGGAVVVQDKSSSVIWGMPGKVAEAGLADSVLPLEGIATLISKNCCPNALVTS